MGRNGSKGDGAAQRGGFFKQHDPVAALCAYHSSLHTGRAAADDRNSPAVAVPLQRVLIEQVLPADQRVDGAFHRTEHSVAAEAVQAAQALADLVLPALFRLHAPLGIAQLAAGDSDKIGHALLEILLRSGRGLDVVYGDDGDGHMLFDLSRQVLFPSLGEGLGLNDGISGLLNAGADIDGGHALLFQRLRDFDGILDLQAAFLKFIHAEPDGDGEAGAAQRLNPGHNLQKKGHPVFRAAAVLVSAVVGGGAEELVDEIAMGGVKLNAVKTGKAGEIRAMGKFPNQRFALLRGQLMGNGALGIPGDRAGGYRLNLAQKGSGSRAARMLELQKDLGVVLMHGVSQADQTADILALRDGELPVHTDAGDIIDPGNLGDDQAAAAFGAGFVEPDDGVIGLAGVAHHICADGRKDDSVAQGKGADFPP